MTGWTRRRTEWMCPLRGSAGWPRGWTRWRRGSAAWRWATAGRRVRRRRVRGRRNPPPPHPPWRSRRRRCRSREKPANTTRCSRRSGRPRLNRRGFSSSSRLRIRGVTTGVITPSNITGVNNTRRSPARTAATGTSNRFTRNRTPKGVATTPTTRRRGVRSRRSRRPRSCRMRRRRVRRCSS